MPSPKAKPKSLTPVLENQDPSIGEQLERISAQGLTAEERLRLALGVINREDLSPEEKLRMEHQILSGSVPSSSGPSDEPSKKQNGTATSSPEASPEETSAQPMSEEPAIWRPDPPQMLVAETDDNAFVRESMRRFLQILTPSMETLSEMQQALAGTEQERAQSLALQQQLVLYEAARTVAIQIHLMHEEQSPDLTKTGSAGLELPDLGLIDQDGQRLRKRKTDA